MAAKPSQFLDWTDGDSSKVFEPPEALKNSGWVAGEAPPFDYMNWLFYMTDQWIQYFEGAIGGTSSALNLMASTRLIAGGDWLWTYTTTTLSWSAAFQLAVPGMADSANQVAAGSIVLADGEVAYLAANIPFTLEGTVTNGSPTISAMASTAGIAVGMTISHASIPGGTTVLSIGAGTVTMSANATGTAATTDITFQGSGALTAAKVASASMVPNLNTVVFARRVGQNVYVGVGSGQFELHPLEKKKILDTGYSSVSDQTAGETLVVGSLVYMAPSGDSAGGARTQGRMYKADVSVANGAVRGRAVGFAAMGAAAAEIIPIVHSGILTGFSGLTQGALYFADPTTPGGITATRPTTASQYVVPVGVALSSTVILVDIGAQEIIPTTTVAYAAETVTAADSPKTLSAGDTKKIFFLDTRNGPITFNLPAVAASLEFGFVDIYGTLSQNKVTLAYSTDPIMGLAVNYDLKADFGHWSIVTDSVGWWLRW